MDTSDSGIKPKTSMINGEDNNQAPWPTVDKKAWLQETLDDHFQCILCGGELQFLHKTDFVNLVVTEDATCACCKVRNRQSTHKLQ